MIGIQQDGYIDCFDQTNISKIEILKEGKYCEVALPPKANKWIETIDEEILEAI
ncbi:hypothetical protein LQZ18_13970 [Lachnospiraceae bacterium ZAX-1]